MYRPFAVVSRTPFLLAASLLSVVSCSDDSSSGDGDGGAHGDGGGDGTGGDGTGGDGTGGDGTGGDGTGGDGTGGDGTGGDGTGGDGTGGDGTGGDGTGGDGTGGDGTGGDGTGGDGTGGDGTGGDGTGGATNTGGTDQGSGGAGSSDETGTYVYIGSGTWGDSEEGLITVYKMDRESRLLSFVSDHEAGGLASYLVVDTENHRLFATDEDDGGVLAFSIDPSTGQLTPNGAKQGNAHPVHVSLTPDADYLLAANYTEGSINVFPISDSGQLQASVQTANTGNNAHSIVIDSQNRVLVANEGSNTISRFTFAEGVLTPGAPATTVHTSPRHILFGPEGRAYVMSEDDDNLHAYSLENSGLSTHFSTPRLPEGETGAGADVRVTPDGMFVYGTNREPSNTIVAVNALDGLVIEHESTRGTTPRSLAMDPQGDFLIVANQGDSSLATFDIESDGSLTHVLTEPLDVTPFFVTVVDM